VCGPNIWGFCFASAIAVIILGLIVVFILYPNDVWMETSLAIQKRFHPGLKDHPQDTPISAIIITAILLAFLLGGVAMAVYGLILWTTLDLRCTEIFEDQFWWLFLAMKTNTVLLVIIVLYRYSEFRGVLMKWLLAGERKGRVGT
jgi:hypothetical protein